MKIALAIAKGNLISATCRHRRGHVPEGDAAQGDRGSGCGTTWRTQPGEGGGRGGGGHTRLGNNWDPRWDLAGVLHPPIRPPSSAASEPGEQRKEKLQKYPVGTNHRPGNARLCWLSSAPWRRPAATICGCMAPPTCPQRHPGGLCLGRAAWEGFGTREGMAGPRVGDGDPWSGVRPGGVCQWGS